MDDYVTSGMVVGLGTGSTAAFAGKRAARIMPLLIYLLLELWLSRLRCCCRSVCL